MSFSERDQGFKGYCGGQVRAAQGMAYVWPKFKNYCCLLMFVLGSYLKVKIFLKTGKYNRIFHGNFFKELFCIK